MTLVRSSEHQEHSGGGAVVASAAVNNNNFQRSHSSYDSHSSSNSSGSAGEPWDQRDYAAIEVVKNDYNNNRHQLDNSDNAEDMRTTTTVYEPSDFTTTHEDDDDEDLNDGELPSLSPKNNGNSSANNSVTSARNNSNNNNNYTIGLGRILGQAMPTTRPMQPPSQAGAAAMKSTNNDASKKRAAVANNSNNNNNKAQQKKFWGQLDEERQVQDNNNNNGDNDEDGPDDELAARRAARAIVTSVRQQGRRPQGGVYEQQGDYHHDEGQYQVLGNSGVESVSLSGQEDASSMAQQSRGGETMTVDSLDDITAAQAAQSFCGQTLAAISDMCGTSLALTSSQDNNNNSNKIDKTSKSRRLSSSSGEVRDDPPYSPRNHKKQVERQEEHTAIEVEFVEPPPQQTTTTNNAIAAKKNAYLSAMAAKAKSDFDNKGSGGTEQQQDHDVAVIGPPASNNANSSSSDIYGSFGAQEKRKFLKMINSGKSPSEASQRIVADRKVAAQKKQDKAARGGGPRLAFWRKNNNKKNNNNKNGKDHEGGDEDEDEEEEDEELASTPPAAAQKSANGSEGSSYATSSDTSGNNAEAADSRSTESPSPPPPPPPPDTNTALSPRLSTTAASPSSASAASSTNSTRPPSILKKQLQLTVDIPTNPTSPKAVSLSTVSTTSPASPTASTTAENAKSPSSSVISAPPSDTAPYHPHRADQYTSNNNKGYPSSTSSVPSGPSSGYATLPGSRSVHSMPIITPGSSTHYSVTSSSGGYGGHSGYVSPASTSHSALSAPVSPNTSALAMGRGDNKRGRTLSPPIVDRKNYVSPTSMQDLPAAALAAMKSLETTATTTTNTSPLEKDSNATNDFARISSPLISRPDVDHDGSERVVDEDDEDEYYGGQHPEQQPRMQISEFAPSGINYYDAVRRDPHSDVDEELEAVIASVARSPNNKNTKSSSIMKLKKGPRLTSVSKPKGFSALKDGPRQQQHQHQHQQQPRSKSAPRGMRLAERARSVSPSPPRSPTPPLPHRLVQRDQTPPRAQSEPGGDISPTRSRAATNNSARASILQSAVRSLTQAKLASETSRNILLDTPSQDTDAGSAKPIKWVDEEVIRRNASQRSGLSSVSGDTGEMESQRRRATATTSQEVQSLPVVTPTEQAHDDKSIRPVTPPAISATVEGASSPNEHVASAGFPVGGQRSTSASPPLSIKSEPVTSSPFRQAEKGDETHVDTKAMEIDMDTYLSSMDEIAAHNGANFDSQSVYTSATGTSSYTQSSRKRRPGAAKERLAKTKEANQKKNGWHESIRAAATNANRVWDPEFGWTDYHDPDAIAPKSDEKIHINLERMRSKGSKDDSHLDVVRRSSDDTVSVPFPKEWETERERMLGGSQRVPVARVSREEPRATRTIETQPFFVEPNAAKSIEMKPLKNDFMDTLPPIDLVEPPIPLDGPPRVAGRTTPKRTGGASPHRARPTDVASRPIGWLDSMRAASAAIATDGRTWDPETGWVADGDEDDESIPDVVDFDAPSAVKEDHAYEEEDDVYTEPDMPEPDMAKATVGQSREMSTKSMPTSDERTETEDLRRVLPIPSRDTDGKLKQWVEKSEKRVHDVSAAEDSDRAVASSSAVNEVYIQLGDNGSVREKSHQDSVGAPPMVPDTVDFSASPVLGFSAGDNEDEDARLLDNSGAFPSEDERPMSPPIRIKREKIAAEDLRLFPPAESQEKRAGRRVAAAVAAAAKRDKVKQAREASKYSKEARAAKEHEERREAARLAAYARSKDPVTSTMQRNVAALQPPPQLARRLDDPSKRIATPPRSTNAQETGQRTPSSPPSPPLTRAAGPITPSPQPLGRKPHKETNSLPLQAGIKQAPLSAQIGKPMHPAEAEFKRKHSGPIDVDEVDDDWDSDEDQQHANNDWESRSNSPASSTSKSKLTKAVPRLKASKRDTSPVRVRKEPALAPASAPAPAPARSSPEPQDKNIQSRESSPAEEMLNSVPMVAPESPSVQERLRHWETIVHEHPEKHEEKTAKAVTRNGKGEALKSSVEKMVVAERTISSRDLESENMKVLASERAVSSANDENGDWESYVESTVVSERVVSTRDGNNVVERTMTTTQKVVRSSPTSEMLNGKLVRKPRGDLFKATKSEDEDSLFEFGDKKEANALVHSRLSPIRPVDDPDFDDEKAPSENLSVSDAYGPDLSDRRSFLQRLTECAAPVMAGRAGMTGKTGDLPSAHLAFMSANQVQGSKAAAGRFVPPNLCGRPENIIEEVEDDESVKSSPPRTQLTRVVTPPPTQAQQRPKSAPRPNTRGGDVRPTSSGSVVSDGFGAKTAYLEALAMKTAVSKPRKSRGRSGSSVVSGTSRASSEHSEKWKAFLDRKKMSSNPTPLKSRGSTTSELSTAAERYAAAKLEEMMAKMSEQSKASRAEDDEYEHEYGRSMDERPRLLRKEKADLASYVRGRKLVDEARKTESVSAAHDLAAARVEAMMAALSGPQMEDEQAEI